MSEQERKDGYAEYGRFAQQLAERGHRITGGAELHASTEARTVPPGARRRDRRALRRDAPSRWAATTSIETDDLDDLSSAARSSPRPATPSRSRRTVTPERAPS